MTKPSRYRTHAAEAVKLAASATDPDDKALLLKIAQGWLDLAERASNGIWMRFRAPPPVVRKPNRRRTQA
ncbi:MAG: hypothetical protein JO172_15635 [Hyphomicrobiales bacterium]|nr:hypothetical protein [Hyphomicrobiales bacterium]